MTELFGRKCALTVNRSRYTDLDFVFTIKKTLKPEPNTCEVTVFNLNRERQAELEAIAPKGSKQATVGIPCEIEAGYEGGMSLLWRGDLRTIETTDDGPNAVTTLTSGDGEKSWKHARLHVSYGPQTPLDTSLRAIARALGVDEGNLSKTVAKLKVGGSAIWPTGKVLTGAASRQLMAIARSADLEVSIQDGALQFLARGKALEGRALKLSSDTGLVGSPSVDNEGIVTFRTLMIPDLRCGASVVLDAKRVKGGYRLIEIEWSGDTSSTDWYADCKGDPL
jgi:hypothetical protein